MADDQSDHAGLLQEILDRLKVLETQAPLEASSIGRGGVRVYDGGKITFDGGNTASDIEIGIVGDQAQIGMGKAILFSGAGFMQLRMHDDAGETTGIVYMTEESVSVESHGFGVAMDADGLRLIGVPNGTAARALGVDSDGHVVKFTGGTGPHPPGTYVWPFPLSSVTSEFGPRDGRFHEGIDEGNPPALSGANIHSIGPGTVIESGWHSSTGFGNWVVINHGNRVISGTTYTLKSVYGHMLNTPPVSVGTAVTSSTVIGQVGNTGGSFGAHLHLETHLCAAGGGAIIWRTSDPSWDAGRTAANPRTVMAALGATGG